jgi:hypothetical protein
MAFATAPIASPNAVASTSGWWESSIAFKVGGAMALASIPVIVLLGYPIARLVVER